MVAVTGTEQHNGQVTRKGPGRSVLSAPYLSTTLRQRVLAALIEADIGKFTVNCVI